MCSGGQWKPGYIYNLIITFINFGCLFWNIRGADLPIHQVFFAENLLGIPHNLGGRRCRGKKKRRGGDFFSISSTITFPLTAYAKSFVGEKKAQAKKRSVHNNNYLCPFCFCSFHVRALFSRAARVTALEGWNISCWRRFVIEGPLTQPFVALRCLILFPFLLKPIPSL